jgi:hypothetical protein
MMLKPITIDDILHVYSMKQERRRRRKCDHDDDTEWKVVKPKKWKPRKDLVLPRDAEQSELLQVAIEKGLRAQKKQMIHIKQRLREQQPRFSRRDQWRLCALNPYSGAKWAATLETAIRANNATKNLWFVTIIDDGWTLGTYPVEPSEQAFLNLLRQMRQQTRRLLRGFSYLLEADFALRRYAGTGHRFIELHWHGLVWANKAQMKAIAKRFSPNRYRAKGLDWKAVYDLSGALRYITKDTRLGYLTVENRGFGPTPHSQKGWFHYREPLLSSQRRLLLCVFGRLTKPELCTVSGTGNIVLQEARELAKSRGYRRSRSVITATRT